MSEADDPPAPSDAPQERADAAQPRLSLVATFTVEPIEDPLRFWFSTLGMPWDVEFAGYNQVFQELLTPGSLLSQNRAGYPAILLRVEDFLRDKPALLDTVDAVTARSIELERITNLFASALREFCQSRGRHVLLVLLPPSPSLPKAEHAEFNRHTQALRDELTAIPHLVTLGEEALAPYGVEDGYDAEQDHLAHVPYTPSMFAALATLIARRVHMLEVPARKLLVLDCDNTLWGGVVGEDGPLGLTLGPAHLALQRFAAKQAADGVLIALCSKNVEADVEAAFNQRSDFPLSASQIVSRRVNWLPKSQNILSLVRELNIGLDSVVFIDDNPVECAEVRAAHPAVLTIQFPQSVELAQRLVDHLWVFDRLNVTSEDRKRAEMYRQNAERRRFKEQAVNFGDFLAALELVIDIEPLTTDAVARVAQLTQRTNQFNTTTLRRSDAEVAALGQQGTECRCIRVRDRFGDYGLVGVMTFAPRDGALLVDSLMLSCRVLGRGVEHAMVRHLGAFAAELGLESVRIRARRSKKNEPVMSFLEGAAADRRVDDADGSTYVLPLELARELTFSPEAAPEVDPEGAAAQEPPISVRRWVDVSAVYERVAIELSTAAGIHRAVQSSRQRTRPVDAPHAPPTSDTERTLVAIWGEVLGITGVGIDDDFFMLGGSSLLAARMVAEFQRASGVQLPLSALLETPTVRGLAARATSDVTEPSNGVVLLRRGTATGRTLFFIHDGFGETLLYLNLARRLPGDFSVYGLEPKRMPHVPLAHDSIEGMARHYRQQVQSIQPKGPYFLGGLCAGGVIALELASQLRSQGNDVELVAMLDSGAPLGTRRRGVVASQRFGRLASLFSQLKEEPSATQLVNVARQAGEKLLGAARYELESRILGHRDQALYQLFRTLLKFERDWPAWLPAWRTQQLYDLAEEHYRPNMQRPAKKVLLFKATAGEGADRPYRELFEDDDFSWSKWVGGVQVIEVAGGHSSMLQEPLVNDLTSKLLPFLD